MLKVAFFGSAGSYALRHVHEVAQHHKVIAMVRPRPRRFPLLAPLRRWMAAGRWETTARRYRATCLYARSGSDERVANQLRRLAPDIICIASYPWILPPDVYREPALGAVNVHASLLPRHRGILPLFWIYYHDDRETGVTVHRVDRDADTGHVLAQEAHPLPRGYDVERLNARNAAQGAALLAATLDAIERDAVSEQPQDASRATSAPQITRPGRMVAFDTWPVERVWHFLAGLQARYRETVHDTAGRPVVYRTVGPYREEPHQLSPGTVVTRDGELRLHCVGGSVALGV